MLSFTGEVSMGEVGRTILLPYTCVNGPQKQGENPMNNMYRALLKLMIVPVLV